MVTIEGNRTIAIQLNILVMWIIWVVMWNIVVLWFFVCYGITNDDEDVMFTIEHELFSIRTISLSIRIVISSMVNTIMEELTTKITNSTI
jgi:hypothetical protein